MEEWVRIQQGELIQLLPYQLITQCDPIGTLTSLNQPTVNITEYLLDTLNNQEEVKTNLKYRIDY